MQFSQFTEKTVGEMLSSMAARLGDKQMIKYTDRAYARSWAEFDHETDLAACGFMALGVEKGDHVAIWATNIPEWLITLFACAKIGAVLVTVNTNYKIYELEYLLRQSDTKLLVMNGGFKDANYVEIVNKLCPSLKDSRPGEYCDPKLSRLETVVYCGGDAPRGMLGFNRLFDIADVVPEQELRRRKQALCCHDVVNIQYTSGTTGFPKGVMLTHYNIVNNGLSIGDCMAFSPDDKLCIPVPFFHCFGLVLAVMAALTHGAAMVPINYYRPLDVMRAVANERCTAVHGVPTMFIAMLEHPEFKNFDTTSLRTGIMAGSLCPAPVMEQVIDEMGMRDITIVFGQTESSPGCTQTVPQDSFEQKVATVGRALPGVEIKIVDPDTEKQVESGVAGEFCARGYNIMKGYYNMAEATAHAIDKDGWLHTGDLATCDENGYYKIVGRIKDMIIRGGENIYPKEIEEFLYTHDSVSDVQVVGVPSRQYGEEVMACVIPKQGSGITEQQLKDFVLGNMARHKVPRYIEFVESFPMTASGKIQKYKLREWAIEKHGLADEDQFESA